LLLQFAPPGVISGRVDVVLGQGLGHAML
jgi:hypothetical protein